MATKDNIFIHKLKLNTIIGVFECEKQYPQLVLADISFKVDLQKACDSDNLKDTLDYGTACSLIIEYAASNSHELLESLAESIYKLCKKNFIFEEISITLNKPCAIKEADSVGVTIVREY